MWWFVAGLAVGIIFACLWTVCRLLAAAKEEDQQRSKAIGAAIAAGERFLKETERQ